MAVTPTYSWPTPDDTDLVRDGAEAIRDLGDAIDTTVSEIDVATTKGDLLVYDGTDYQRLAVGTNDHILTADSGETTGVKWSPVVSGGLTLIASGTLSGSAVNITGIPGTYRSLWFEFTEAKLVSSTATLRMRLNNDTGSVYVQSILTETATSFTAATDNSFSNLSMASTGRGTSAWLEIVNYNSNNYYPTIQMQGVNSSNQSVWTWLRYNNSTSTITQINFNLSSGSFGSGNYALYGMS